jgi:hypothetical protein
MDYFVISLIEELEKIANINAEINLKKQQQVKNAVNNNSAKKLLASKSSVNNKARVGSPQQQNAVQALEEIKNG